MRLLSTISINPSTAARMLSHLNVSLHENNDDMLESGLKQQTTFLSFSLHLVDMSKFLNRIMLTGSLLQRIGDDFGAIRRYSLL